MLDAYDFCSESLQRKLKVHRDRHAARLLQDSGDASAPQNGTHRSGMEEEEEEGGAQKTEAASAGAGAASDAASAGGDDEKVGPGLPKAFRGLYELYAVVTHKGRSADGGHYIGWVRQKGGSCRRWPHAVARDRCSPPGALRRVGPADDWVCFDDDSVSPCRTEDVMKLKGGGDYDMAYLAYYRAKE